MKMKHLLLTIFLSIAAMLSTSFAQDNTKVGLPEGAIARLGKGGINLMRFSPDGKTLLDSKWSEARIQLWDVDTGRSLGTLSGHTEPIETLVFSHDGKTLASGSEDGTVLLWDWNEIIDKNARDNNSIQ